jgi:tetratricopeptide (TPR) repeat protein
LSETNTIGYYQQAGARAYDRAAFREAVVYFEQALQALAYLPESGDTRALAIELRLALAPTLGALGEYRRYLALLGEAEALARALDDRARLGRVLAGRASVLRVTGDLDGAMAAGQQALALAAELGESAVQVHASYNLGGHTMPSATSAGQLRCSGRTSRLQTRSLARSVWTFGFGPRRGWRGS